MHQGEALPTTISDDSHAITERVRPDYHSLLGLEHYIDPLFIFLNPHDHNKSILITCIKEKLLGNCIG